MAYRITIHCTASPNRKRYDIEKIRKDHKARGWSDVGYHCVVQPDGELQNGRPLNQPGAHVGGANTRNIGIALVGNTLFTRKQFDALKYFVDGVKMTYDIPPHKIFCHYEFPSARKQGKSCPNIRAADLVLWLYNQDDKIISDYLVKEDRNE